MPGSGARQRRQAARAAKRQKLDVVAHNQAGGLLPSLQLLVDQGAPLLATEPLFHRAGTDSRPWPEPDTSSGPTGFGAVYAGPVPAASVLPRTGYSVRVKWDPFELPADCHLGSKRYGTWVSNLLAALVNSAHPHVVAVDMPSRPERAGSIGLHLAGTFEGDNVAERRQLYAQRTFPILTWSRSRSATCTLRFCAEVHLLRF